MLVLNNTPFVHPRVYLQYFNSALPGVKLLHVLNVLNILGTMLTNEPNDLPI